eukprot:4458937-Pyramimonas_sp.AAC.1
MEGPKHPEASEVRIGELEKQLLMLQSAVQRFGRTVGGRSPWERSEPPPNDPNGPLQFAPPLNGMGTVPLYVAYRPTRDSCSGAQEDPQNEIILNI